MRGPCLKQLVKCTIVRADGRRYEGTNTCDVDRACPRVMLSLKNGEGYHLCQSLHAEANAAILARESIDVEGIAYVEGHDFFCRECQHALQAVNVRRFVLGPPPVNTTGEMWEISRHELEHDTLMVRNVPSIVVRTVEQMYRDLREQGAFTNRNLQIILRETQ